MTQGFSPAYLERLSRIEAPKSFSFQESQIYHDYCELRNSAKGLLRNPNDRTAVRTLSRLMLKLNIEILN